MNGSRRRALMGEKKDNKYTIESLLASITNGDYSTKYAVGDLIKMTTSSYGELEMQIVGFDVDALSDDTGYAPVTLVSTRSITSTKWTTNSTNAGGYPLATIRSYLNNTVASRVQSVTGSEHLAMVKKSSYGPANTVNPARSDPRSTLWSDDLVWIPSAREWGRTDRENAGPKYSGMQKSIGVQYLIRSTYTEKTGTTDIILANGTYGTDYGFGTNRAVRIGICLK